MHYEFATDATAYGLPSYLQKRHLDFYNSLVEKRNSLPILSPVESKLSFWKMLREDFPLQHKFFVKKFASERNIAMLRIFRFLFPTPKCSVCGKSSTLKSKPTFCSRQCVYYHSTGYWSPASNPKVKDKKTKTNLLRRGVENPFQAEDVKQTIRETLLRERNIDHSSKDPNVIEKKRVNHRKKHGVDNPSQREEVKLKKKKTCLKIRGVEHPMMCAEIADKGKATRLRKTGYEHALQDPKSLRKFVRTMRRVWNVDNPLQHPEIFKKQAKSAFRISTHTFLGRSYRVQSTFEAWAYEMFADVYGVENVHTQFHKEFPSDVFQRAKTFPDLYIESLDRFVEVKSNWYLLGTMVNGWLNDNRKKAKQAHDLGVKVRWIVPLNLKQNKYALLPNTWYKMSRKQLKEFLDSRR